MPSLTRLLWKCRSVYTLNAALVVAIFVIFVFTIGMNDTFTLPTHQTAVTDLNKVKRDFDSVKELQSETVQISHQEDDSKPLNGFSLDINSRMESQKALVQEFCSKHPELREAPRKEWLRRDMFKHLLYNDKKKIIFCYVPKVGCSNWKRMFLVLEKRLPVPHKGEKRPSESFLNSASKLMNLPDSEREWRIKEYTKFTIMRDPLERIVSGYNNKINHPLSGNLSVFPEFVKYDIIKKWSPQSLKEYEQSNRKLEVIPSFDDFLKYLSTTDQNMLNEHFKSFMNLCHPCYVNYHFYGNFKLLPDEAFSMLDYFKIPREYYPTSVSHPALSTSSLLPLYYSDMTPQQKVVYARELATTHQASMPQFPHGALTDELYRKTFSVFSGDLELYYALYPEDKLKHGKFRGNSA